MDNLHAKIDIIAQTTLPLVHYTFHCTFPPQEQQ